MYCSTGCLVYLGLWLPYGILLGRGTLDGLSRPLVGQESLLGHTGLCTGLVGFVAKQRMVRDRRT